VRSVKLDEIRMSWVVDHIRSDDTFRAISAFNGHDHKLDMANHERLKKHIRKLGHGFVELEETWKGGKERSLFVPGMRRENTTSIRKHFKQDTVIRKDKDHFHMYNPRTGDVDKEYSKSDPVTFAKDAVKDFSSRLIKRGHRKKEWAFQPEKQPIGFRLRERESYQKLRWTAATVTLGWLTIYDENEPDPNERYGHVWEAVERGRGSNEIR